jgi:hypothetical protein
MSSSQIVTFPFVKELYDPDYLELLLPQINVKASPVKAQSPAPPKNAMIEALERTVHQTLTENLAPAFDSTLSATLDAFNGLRREARWADIERLISDAWTEDPAITLRIIWNLRSIHDGKGENTLFYR